MARDFSARAWTVYQRPYSAATELGGVFFSTGAVYVGTNAQDASEQASSASGSAFVINTSAVVTAAHVVVDPTTDSPFPSISVDFGARRLWAWRVAVDANYRVGPGYSALNDLAVLALVGQACGQDEAIVAAPIEPGRPTPCLIRSGLGAFGGAVSVSATRDGDWIDYVTSNLRGYSGGPVLLEDAPSNATGVHVWYTGELEGRALTLSDSVVVSALQAINGFGSQV